MARIPEHIVDQIYNSVDIVEVVGDYLPLKKKGANFWGLSPWSNEKTPSFSVHPGKGIYKDFSSGKGGNSVNFVMEMEGLTYVEALRHLAKKYSIELQEEEDSPEQREQKNKRQSLFIVNEFAAEFYHKKLLEDEKGKQIGLSYFKERGILAATVDTFQLGYALDEWEDFAQAAIKKQYKEEYLVELSLVSKSEKTGKLIDRFRGRVMFPIANPSGKVVGFGGRILGNRKDTAKYINSSESEIYHKSQVLYGLYQAKKFIRDEDLCILTEGYMDTIVLHQNGVKNVVASSGTALTKEQIRLIRRFSRNVLMIYDGDKAGIKAALRGIDILIREGMEAKVLILPDGHDPDSYVREKGASAFAEIQKTALNFVDFKLQVLSEDKDIHDPRVQSELIKALAESVANIPDRVDREMYVRHVAQKVDITESLMAHAVLEARGEQQKLVRREQKREEARQAVSAPAEVKELKSFEQLELANQEKELLRVMICHFDKTVLEDPNLPLEDKEGNPIEYEEFPVMEYMIDELENLVFENQTYEQLKNEMFKEYQDKQKIDLNKYLSHPDSVIRNLVSDLLTAPETSPLWKKIRPDIDYDSNLTLVTDGAIFHYKSRKVDKMLRECRSKIKEAEQAGKEEEVERLCEIYLELQEMDKEINKKLGLEGARKGLDAQL
ncbi:MAG: DNA primase [Bacteroidota bacterium]